MTTSNKRLVELSILKKRTKSAQARKAVAFLGKHIYLVSAFLIRRPRGSGIILYIMWKSIG